MIAAEGEHKASRPLTHWLWWQIMIAKMTKIIITRSFQGDRCRGWAQSKPRPETRRRCDLRESCSFAGDHEQGFKKKCHVLQNICNNVYFNSFIVFTPLWVFLWCDRLILLANVLGHTSQDISFGILKYNRLFRLAISSDCFELQQL